MKRMSAYAVFAAGVAALSLVLPLGCVSTPEASGPGSGDPSGSPVGERANTRIAESINSLLRQGGEVKILLLMSPEQVTYVPAGDQAPPGPEWFESVARQVEAGYMEKLFRSHPQVTIVDRSALDAALKELELQSSGLVGMDTMTRVGSFVGANYIVSLSFARHITKRGYQDTYIRKLIELATSRVLASDQVKHEYRRDEKGQAVLVLQTLNGRPFVTDSEGNSYYK